MVNFTDHVFVEDGATMADVENRPAAVKADTEDKPVAPPADVESTTTADANDANDKEEPITTVFHDHLNYNVKHPLHNAWTLWFDNPGKKANTQSWSQNLKEIVTVETVEDFWG